MAQPEKDIAMAKRHTYLPRLEEYMAAWGRLSPPDVGTRHKHFTCYLWAERDILQKELTKARTQMSKLRKREAA